MTPVAICLVVP